VALLAHDSCPVNGECITAGGGGFSRLYVAQTRGIVDRDITVEKLAARFDEVMDETGALSLSAGFIDVTQWAAKPYRKASA
jgi:hypothetical protein